LRDHERAAQALAAGEALAHGPFANDAEASRQFALLRVTMLVRARRPASAVDPRLDPSPRAAGVRSLTPRVDGARAGCAGAQAQRRPGRRRGRCARRPRPCRTWVAEHKKDALAWQTLAQCAEPLGLRLRSLRAGAEAAYASGDVLARWNRLRVARQIAQETRSDDYIEVSVIQSRPARDGSRPAPSCWPRCAAIEHPEDTQ
jgi:hypothetical protein